MPGESDTHASTTRERLDPEQFRTAVSASDPATRQEAVAAFRRAVRADVDRARRHVDAVARRLDDERLAVRHAAAAALRPVAEQRPGELVGWTDRLVGLLSADATDLAVAGAALLSPVAVERPAALAAHLDGLLDAVEAGEADQPEPTCPDSVDRPGTRRIVEGVQTEARERRRYVRQTAANVVVAVAEADPAAVEAVERIEGLLDVDDPAVVGAMVDTLGYVGAAAPDRVRPTRASLVDCLDHEQTSVRARAVGALGHLGDESVVPELEETAARDPDDDVAALAAETAAFLAA